MACACRCRTGGTRACVMSRCRRWNPASSGENAPSVRTIMTWTQVCPEGFALTLDRRLPQWLELRRRRRWCRRAICRCRPVLGLRVLPGEATLPSCRRPRPALRRPGRCRCPGRRRAACWSSCWVHRLGRLAAGVGHHDAHHGSSGQQVPPVTASHRLRLPWSCCRCFRALRPAGHRPRAGGRWRRRSWCARPRRRGPPPRSRPGAAAVVRTVDWDRSCGPSPSVAVRAEEAARERGPALPRCVLAAVAGVPGCGGGWR